MNILILNGSPRMNGNTRTLLNTMKQQLEEKHTVELVDVCRKKLSGCVACDGCKTNGGHCVQPDDSDAVIGKILAADLVVFGTPVYWWGMSSQMKMVVDKLYSIQKKEPKKVGVVAVGASGVDNIQYRLIREQFACIAQHMKWETAFSLSFSASAPGEIAQNKAALAEVRRTAETL